ncbi:hypothetical protein [Rhizohabitans arisaemae]|uniref:hypothetical protein n=1 Tax=Rhizohabitans arisaemae TaxID=2720610 RepID=UPI0024B1BD06|nr:hypothetical protein [Rhizohabitans arisaemae]
MGFKKLAAVLSVTALITGTTILGTASAAHAQPTGCSAQVGPTGTTVTSHCSGGYGYHKVVVYVKHRIPWNDYIISEGPWRPVGEVSEAYLPPGPILYLFYSTHSW